jgi:hypothetical protein
LAQSAHQPLYNDLGNRVTEAAMLAMIKTLFEPVVSPSREVAANKEKWRPVKELADAGKASTALIGKCRFFVFGVQKLLENREQMFETLDRVAAAVEAGSAIGLLRTQQVENVK